MNKIHALYDDGYSKRAIAKELGFSRFAISYWLKTPEQRAELIKRNYLKRKQDGKIDKVAKAKSARKTHLYRKKILDVKELKEFVRQQANNFKKEGTKDRKIYAKKFTAKLMK